MVVDLWLMSLVWGVIVCKKALIKFAWYFIFFFDLAKAAPLAPMTTLRIYMYYQLTVYSVAFTLTRPNNLKDQRQHGLPSGTTTTQEQGAKQTSYFSFCFSSSPVSQCKLRFFRSGVCTCFFLDQVILSAASLCRVDASACSSRQLP